MNAPALLAGCLQSAGISAKGIDFNAEFLNYFKDDSNLIQFKNFLCLGHTFQPKFNKTFFKKVLKFTKKFLFDLVEKHQPNYFGLSIFTSESLDFGLILSYVIRKYFPKIKIIAGGKGLETNSNLKEKHYEVWIKNTIVFTIVVGDAESAIIDVINNNKLGLVHAAKQLKEDLDNIPLPIWKDYNFKLYSEIASIQDRTDTVIEPYFPITASKGCVRKCTFCDVANFWPEYIYRDPVKVAEEIIHNYNSTGVRNYLFTDNLINGSITNFRIMNQILSGKIPNTIKYRGYAIFRGKNQMPEEDFKLASIAGSQRWFIGVESGSEKIRYEMKKKFTNDDIDWTANLLYKYNIEQNWLLIVGYPSETEKDFSETKKLLKNFAHLATNGQIKIQITPTFMLLNNSPLIENPELKNYYGLNLNDDKHADKFWTSTKFLDNDYPTRSRRWKELVSLTETLGYQFGGGMPVKKWQQEIENLDKIYSEKNVKIFAIRQK